MSAPDIPDISQLGVESPERQFELQNAEQTMTPPVQQPTGNPSVIKGLLTNFFQGFGAAAMKHAGLETPQEQQQRQQQMALQQQVAQSTAQYHQALAKNLADQNELVPWQPPPNADGTPNEPVMIARKSLPTILGSQVRAQAQIQTHQGGTQITPEMEAAIPELKGLAGQNLPKPVLDLISRTAAARIQTQGKSPTEMALRVRADQGDTDAQRILDRMQKDKIAQATARGMAYGAGRPGGYIDPNTGELSTQFAGTAINQGLVPSQSGIPVMSKQAQFSEMHTASSRLRDAITNLDRDFTPEQRAKLTLAMRAPNEGLVANLRDSLLGTEQLTPAQQDYVIWSTQMHERLLSLRSIAGMGQGAQDLRSAIQATLPSVKSADKGYALKQMDAVDQQINQLEGGIPKFPKRDGASSGVQLPPGAPAAPSQDGKLLRFAGKVIAKSQGGKWVAP